VVVVVVVLVLVVVVVVVIILPRREVRVAVATVLVVVAVVVANGNRSSNISSIRTPILIYSDLYQKVRRFGCGSRYSTSSPHNISGSTSGTGTDSSCSNTKYGSGGVAAEIVQGNAIVFVSVVVVIWQ
jgi:hypothetical protein